MVLIVSYNSTFNIKACFIPINLSFTTKGMVFLSMENWRLRWFSTYSVHLSGKYIHHIKKLYKLKITSHWILSAAPVSSVPTTPMVPSISLFLSRCECFKAGEINVVLRVTRFIMDHCKWWLKLAWLVAWFSVTHASYYNNHQNIFLGHRWLLQIKAAHIVWEHWSKLQHI
jgi:hypothetical protein